jgi:hypothetical protein
MICLLELLSSRREAVAAEPERGDVAEKIVIVGIFVALAIAVGMLISHAVTNDATKISKTISGAP